MALPLLNKKRTSLVLRHDAFYVIAFVYHATRGCMSLPASPRQSWRHWVLHRQSRQYAWATNIARHVNITFTPLMSRYYWMPGGFASLGARFRSHMRRRAAALSALGQRRLSLLRAGHASALPYAIKMPSYYCAKTRMRYATAVAINSTTMPYFVVAEEGFTLPLTSSSEKVPATPLSARCAPDFAIRRPAKRMQHTRFARRLIALMPPYYAQLATYWETSRRMLKTPNMEHSVRAAIMLSWAIHYIVAIAHIFAAVADAVLLLIRRHTLHASPRCYHQRRWAIFYSAQSRRFLPLLITPRSYYDNSCFAWVTPDFPDMPYASVVDIRRLALRCFTVPSLFYFCRHRQRRCLLYDTVFRRYTLGSHAGHGLFCRQLSQPPQEY